MFSDVIVVFQLLCLASWCNLGFMSSFECTSGSACKINQDNISTSGQQSWILGTRNVTSCHKGDYMIFGTNFQITNMRDEDRECIVFTNYLTDEKSRVCSYTPDGTKFQEDCNDIDVTNYQVPDCSSSCSTVPVDLCAKDAEKEFLPCHVFCGLTVADDCNRRKQTIAMFRRSVVEVTIPVGNVETTTITTTATPATTVQSTTAPAATEAQSTLAYTPLPSTTIQASAKENLEAAEEALGKALQDGGMTRQDFQDVIDAMTTVSKSGDITDKMAGMFVNAASALLNKTNQEHLNNHTIDMLETIEDFACNAARQMDHEWIQVQENIEIQIIPIETNADHPVATRDHDGQIAIEISVDGEVNGTLAAVMYKTLQEDMPTTTPGKSTNEIASHVVSISVIGVYNVDKPNRITFKTDKHVHPRNCFYWNFTQNMWNQNGCRKTDENASHLTCECDHMTNFAILMSYSERAVSERSPVLSMITMVGGGISIACLFAMMAIYGRLRLLLQERFMVHANLAISLFVGQLVFVLGSQASEDPDICRLVAFLLHFAFLGSFSWTAVEGLQLYMKSVRIFNPGGDMRAMYVILGWGMPVIVVGVCFPIGFADYGAGADGLESQSCWLHGTSRWGFIGPAIAIMVFNLIVVGLVLRVLLSLKANAKKSGVQKIKSGLKALMVLVPLLGLTWVCGFLVSVDIYFEYIFDVCLPLQGVLLFVLHCLLNDEVRKKLKLHRNIIKVAPANSSTSSTLGLTQTNVNISRTATKLTLASNMLSPLPSKCSHEMEEREFSPRRLVLIPRSGTVEPGIHVH